MIHLRSAKWRGEWTDGALCWAPPVETGGGNKALLLDDVTTNCPECQLMINMRILEEISKLN